MSTHTYKKYEDGDSNVPDKMNVFQECQRAFNATPVDAKKCRLLLARLLRLLYSGETFPRQEATTLFFSISKLFQHKDSSLRQIVYLAIKELCIMSDDILMVTSSIMKDVQNGDIIYKPNAIRTLARVLDGTTVHAAERLLKNAIVDKHPSVSSAALVSSYHLLSVSKDVVKRWTNETQEAVLANKSFPSTGDMYVTESLMTQYHALGLLYELRNHDKMALRKLIQQFSKSLRNPLAICQLIRYINEILQNDPSLIPTLFPLLHDWMNVRHHSVNLEAIKVAVSLPVTDVQFADAVQRLQFLLTSPKTVSRFAAVRILNRISLKNPEKIATCNNELESLINDPNRSIATYAITTLLKTGSSDSIARLIKVMSKFINEISDEFKIIIIDAVKTLSLKFPQNYRAMLNFLVDMLNDEGGFEFKSAIIEAMFDLIHFVPESRDSALGSLCEFIEDCEYSELAVRVLNLLGNEGPKTTNPTLYIRHIYNRVVLENSIVRSAAVVALSKFALINDNINQSVKVLLKRIVSDVDDEVRDRAIISLKFLEGLEQSTATKEQVIELTKPSHTYDLALLETKLQTYLSGDVSSFVTPFDISLIPKLSEDEFRAVELQRKTTKLESRHDSGEERPEVADESAQTAELAQQLNIQELSQIASFASYGAVLHSSAAVPLTEKDNEFVVEVVKHIFAKHIVLQYSIESTLDDTLLEDVSVEVEAEDDIGTAEVISIDSLAPHAKGTAYLAFARPEGIDVFTTTLATTLTFTTKECDSNLVPIGDGYEDQYDVERFVINAGDYIHASFIGNFDLAFDELTSEAVGTFHIDAESIQEAVGQIIINTCMHPVEGKDVFNETSHTLKLFGKSLAGERIGVIVKFVKSSNKPVAIKVVVKTDNDELANAVLEGVAA